jgi:hypothetical protein
LKARAVCAATCSELGRHIARDMGESTDKGFALLHIFFSEEELTIQVGKVDGIQVKERNLLETSEDEIFDWKEQ